MLLVGFNRRFAPATRKAKEFFAGVGAQLAVSIRFNQCFITLRHANGAVSSVAYLAGGDRAFPKDRVEVLGGGRVAVIDDFRSVTTSVGGRMRTKRLGIQDKGRQAEVKAFAEAITSGGSAPIPWSDLYAVSLASILAVRSLREGCPFEIPAF